MEWTGDSTEEGPIHHIPIGTIKMATNMTRQFGRANFTVPVAYGTDLDHAI